jgi:hypothetical protein
MIQSMLILLTAVNNSVTIILQSIPKQIKQITKNAQYLETIIISRFNSGTAPISMALNIKLKKQQ